MATVCILRNSRLNHVMIRGILRSEFNKCMIYLIFRNEIQAFYNLKAYFLKQYIILRKLSPEKKKILMELGGKVKLHIRCLISFRLTAVR